MNNRALIEGEKAAKWGILYLSLVGTGKLIAGALTGMTVIVADGISTISDTLGLFASYVGLSLSRRKADDHFEYGYYKIETFAAFLISLGIIYLAYYIFRAGIATFTEVEPGKYRSVALIMTLVGIFQSNRLAKSLMKAGKKANSLSLLASGQDKRMDMFAGIAVVISILANYQGIPYVEGVVSMIIAVLIFKTGIVSSKESLFFLLDYWNDPVLTRKIKHALLSEKGLVTRVTELKLRRAGTFIFGQAFVDVNPYASIEDLRDALDILGKKVTDINEYIKDFDIYTHIPKTESVRIALPVSSGTGLGAIVANNLAQTKGYVFVEVNKGKISKHYHKKLKSSQKKTLQLSDFINIEKVDILIDNKLNSLTYYHLRRTHHVLIYPNFADVKTVEDTVNLLLIDR